MLGYQVPHRGCGRIIFKRLQRECWLGQGQTILSEMNEKPEKQFQFSLASLFAAMTLAALAVWARWWIPFIWVAIFLCGMIALSLVVAIVCILRWAGAHVAHWVSKARPGSS